MLMSRLGVLSVVFVVMMRLIVIVGMMVIIGVVVIVMSVMEWLMCDGGVIGIVVRVLSVSCMLFDVVELCFMWC